MFNRKHNARIAAAQNEAQRKGARVAALENVGGHYAPMRRESRDAYAMHGARRFTADQLDTAARLSAGLSFA